MNIGDVVIYTLPNKERSVRTGRILAIIEYEYAITTRLGYIVWIHINDVVKE